MNFVVSTVPTGHITQVLPRIMEFIQRTSMSSRGRTLPDDILAEILNGVATLWVAINTDTSDIHGILVSRVVQYPRRKMMSVFSCSGNDVKEYIDQATLLFKSWARDNQCDGIEFIGRRGWGKALEKHGAALTFYMFELPLD
jgi:hypothetical protein